MLNISEEVLVALVTHDINHKDIVTKLATYHPSIFMSLLHLDDLTYQVQRVYSTNKGKKNVIAAIKKYRELTGTDLKTSKLAVEQMSATGAIKVIDWDEDVPAEPEEYDFTD